MEQLECILRIDVVRPDEIRGFCYVKGARVERYAASLEALCACGMFGPSEAARKILREARGRR